MLNFELEKSSKKFNCPGCGAVRKFKRYISKGPAGIFLQKSNAATAKTAAGITWRRRISFVIIRTSKTSHTKQRRNEKRIRSPNTVLLKT
jgi:hypothetical protein